MKLGCDDGCTTVNTIKVIEVFFKLLFHFPYPLHWKGVAGSSSYQGEGIKDHVLAVANLHISRPVSYLVPHVSP